MMEKELPKGWVETKISDVSEIIRGITYKKADAKAIQDDGDFLILRGGNIQDGKIVLSDDAVYVNSDLVKEKQVIKRGDVIIVGSTGSSRLIGKAAFAVEDLPNISFGAFLMMIRPSSQIDARLFNYYFISDNYRNVIRELAGGVNINNIRREHIENLIFPIPPLPEQKRIVAKLDELFGHLDVLREKLDRIPELLKNFRQQVLTQAVTGRLTEEWRNGKELFSALNTISENRKKQYAENVLLTKKQGDKKPKKLDQSDFEFGVFDNSYNLPESWELANVKNIADLLTDGEHATPRRTSEGYYLLSARNVQNGWISLDKVDYVPEDEYLRIKKRCNPEPFDLLLSCSGTVGRTSLVPENLDFVMVRSAALIKLQSNKQSSKFLEYTFRSRLVQNQISQLQKSTAQANIFLGPIGKIVVPIPSQLEQNEIVKRVDSLFSAADKIEAQYQSLKEKIEQLPQAILAKAFKGELVEQLPADGDAKDLLREIEEIKAQTAKQQKHPKKRNYKKTKTELPKAAEKGGVYEKQK